MTGQGGYFWNGRQWVPVATPPPPKAPAKRASPAWGIALILGIFVVAIGVLVLAVTAPARRAATPPAAAETYNAPIAPEPIPTQWWKDGMYLVQPGLAVGWARDQGESVTCPSYTTGCVGVYLMSLASCPGGVYVALSLIDGSTNVIGRANEISGGLLPGDTAVVTVSWIDERVKAQRIAEVSCLE